ncbi:MAG TPA: hypothetical protein PLB31_01330 [Fimbriimonadaceae bacterium]|nr:hypothetical protein [Fimbriimonadaceae bacterium]
MPWMLSLVALLAAGLLWGCTSTKPFYGKWQGERTDILKGDDSPTANTLRIVEVEIKSDGTFVYTSAGFPATGTFRPGNGGLLLDVKEVMGRSIESMGSSAVSQFRPLEVRRVNDTTLEIRDPGGVDRSWIQLKKVEETATTP